MLLAAALCVLVRARSKARRTAGREAEASADEFDGVTAIGGGPSPAHTEMATAGEPLPAGEGTAVAAETHSLYGPVGVPTASTAPTVPVVPGIPMASTARPSAPHVSTGGAVSTSIADQLESLFRLRTAGALSEEDFAAAKAQVLLAQR